MWTTEIKNLKLASIQANLINRECPTSETTDTFFGAE